MKIIPLKITSRKKASSLMSSLGVSPEGIKILSSKSFGIAFRIDGIDSWEANIIKQHMLSLGSDAAIERDALIKDKKTGVIIFGSFSQLKKLSFKLKGQPFSLSRISKDISLYIDNIYKDSFKFFARDKILKIKKCIICGIINITPDSFSGDGLLGRNSVCSIDSALRQAEEMIKYGARIIDVGGESSRPFSKRIPAFREIKRVMPVLRELRKRFPALPISIDTYKSAVAKCAAEEGVDIINDITALGDPRMPAVLKHYGLGCVLMHMKGEPENMQDNPEYKDVMGEILDFFSEKIDFCRRKGVEEKRIMLDPGIGFGKDLNHNLSIINNLDSLKIFGLPVFIGPSRKSFIGKIFASKPSQRLSGTVAACVLALLRGASVLRVHDVKEICQAVKVADKIINS